MSLLASVAAAIAAVTPAPAPLTPPVAAAAARTPDRELRLIVQQRPGFDVAGAVRTAGGRVDRRIGLIDGLAVRLPAAAAPRLARQAGVRAVSLDAPVARTGRKDPEDLGLATSFNQSIRADKAWAAGLTGDGVGVAVIDSGIAGDLPDFRNGRLDPRSRVAVNAVVNPNATAPGDPYGHGTHIAGLIAGNGFNRSSRDPLRGRYLGVAPQATLIAVKAGGDDGEASVLDVIDGLQFVVDHRRLLGIRVVNLSLSSRVAESHLTDPLDAAVEAAWKAGVVVVAAAGNRGDTADAVSYAPGNDPWVITVGGVDEQGTDRISDDELASWSSRGVTQDGYAKPDVLAPGAHLVSTMPPDAAYRTLCPECVVDGDYFRVGGTSMAAAVVSGAVADLLQAHPDWTPDQVKRALRRRSRPVRADDDDDTAVDADGDELPADTTPTTTIVGGEVALDKVLRHYRKRDPLPANWGVRLNDLLDPTTEALDYTRTSWSRTSWSLAIDALRTSWSLLSWSRTSWSGGTWSATPASCIDLERTSWSRTSWSDADLASAHAACDLLLTAIDPTRTSWSRTSWSRTSWSTSFTK
ncbi:MAG: serine protease AprX [Solirubrobacteraceae bacterium]|nr:serine protease AprX [Solirubrobacteraceae bacterium]